MLMVKKLVTAAEDTSRAVVLATVVFAVADIAGATDRAALETLYDATRGLSWKDSTNWKTPAPLGEWYGVETDEAGRVRSLNLSWNGLTGPLPTELADLVALEELSLGFNNLGGVIPTALGSLIHLRELYLPGNDLTGLIPAELGSLPNLQSLQLGNNYLSGPIPAELGRLVNLRGLALDGNRNLSGPIPGELGNLVNLTSLELSGNDLSGLIPTELGSLTQLRRLHLHENDLSGPIPAELGNLASLVWLDLSFNWGLSGPLPSGLTKHSSLEELDIFLSQACAPAAWQEWLATIEFLGGLCGTADDVTTVDVAVVYTSFARESAGGAAGIEAVIDLMVAETNQAYSASGVRHRLALVERSEVAYAEADGGDHVARLSDPEDGYMDEVHALRDRTEADLVHLILGPAGRWCGQAMLPGVFAYTVLDCGGITFAHELGHNMGLHHDRLEDQLSRGAVFSHPAYGYVNQRIVDAGTPPSSRWRTIMSYPTHCRLADVPCSELLRFSNPRQRHGGDPLGIAFGAGAGVVAGAADAAAVLNVTIPMVASWRDGVDRPNRPPAARAGTLPDRELALDSTLDMDMSRAFTDPDGDPLDYAASSSAPDVVTVLAQGFRVRLTAVGAGPATVAVTATDPGGLSAAESFEVTVVTRQVVPTFTDDPLRPGVTPIRAVHFMELRARIGALRASVRLAPFLWTDAILRAGVTPVRLAHLLELREALGTVYGVAGRTVPRWTDAAATAGATPIRAVHVTELRAAVVALEWQR